MKTITCDICGDATPQHAVNRGSVVHVREDTYRKIDMEFIQITDREIDICFRCTSKMVLFVHTELAKQEQKEE